MASRDQQAQGEPAKKVGKGTDFAQSRQDCCTARLAVSNISKKEANNADCQLGDDYGETLQIRPAALAMLS